MLDLIPIGIATIIVILIFVGVELSSIKQELKDVNDSLNDISNTLTDIRDSNSGQEDD